MIKLTNTEHYLGLSISGKEEDLVAFQFYLSRLAECINDQIKPKPKNRVGLCNVIYSIAYDARKASYSAASNPEQTGTLKITWARIFGLVAILSQYFRRIRHRDSELAEYFAEFCGLISSCLVKIRNTQVSVSYGLLLDPPIPYEKKFIQHLGFDAYVNALEICLSSEIMVEERPRFLQGLAVSFFTAGEFNESIIDEIETYVAENNITYQQLVFHESKYKGWVW